MVRRAGCTALAAPVLTAMASLFFQPANAATLPDGFSDALVADIAQPTALAFTPDGRILIASQPGRIHVYENGALFPAPAVDLSLNNRICSNGERGLLGVAVDPDFSRNRFVYLFYAFKKFGVCPLDDPLSPDNPVSRVSRFTLSADNVIDVASERVLINNIPLPRSHIAGDLHFGKDGYLYISAGDGLCDYAGDSGCAGNNNAARDRHVLLGKILRITRDGGIPPTNPFQGADSARCNQTGITDPGNHCQETFATGLRNPFRFAFDPNASGTRFFINDVGQSDWEEIDLGRSGAEYGWNVREGPCPKNRSINCTAAPAQYTDPIYAYNHSTGCEAITGGAFLPNGHWPSQYTGNYFFSDYDCGKIFRLKQQAGGYTSSEFATELGTDSAVYLAFGPHDGGQALYYTSYEDGGQVRRISFTGTANRVPSAVVSATPRSGPLPLDVYFDASTSTDPDGDALTYEWSFDDDSPPVFDQTITHTYTAAGTFHPSLTVTDARGAQAQDSLRIDAGAEAPRVTVLSPSSTTRVRVGQRLLLRARAIDGNGQPLPDSAFVWTALLHHNTHTHPYLSAQPGNGIVITAPAPEDLAAARTSYLELRLVVTDARGLETRVVRNVRPKLVNIRFDTVPAGLRLAVDGTGGRSPRAFTSWQAYRIKVFAPDQENRSGRRFIFKSWSDRGARTHVIITPSSARVYRATFR